MKKIRLTFKIMAVALAMTMLFAACNSDEPNPGTRTSDNYIVFETEGIEWLTTYDVEQNIYYTSLERGVISYTIKKGEYVPDAFVVTKLVKDVDGSTEEIDVSNITSLAKVGDGFYQADAGEIAFNYSQKGILNIELKSVEDVNEVGHEYRSYIIELQDREGTVETTIVINDLRPFYWGTFPMDIELSKIGYPAKRSYNEWTGHYKGYDYTIELPANACEIPLISIDCAVHMNIHNFSITDLSTGNISEEKTPYYDDSTNYPTEYSFSTKHCDFLYKKIRHEYIDVETEETKEFYECNLLCKIDANTTDSAREIKFEIKDGIHLARINFIQVAK